MKRNNHYFNKHRPFYTKGKELNEDKIKELDEVFR